jgi:hypothetical protein
MCDDTDATCDRLEPIIPDPAPRDSIDWPHHIAPKGATKRQRRSSASSTFSKARTTDEDLVTGLNLAMAEQWLPENKNAFPRSDARRLSRLERSRAKLQRGQTTWKWEHKTGFLSYDTDSASRIEAAYQHGDSMVRLKSGKSGNAPMQVNFTVMHQLDPITGNRRRICRDPEPGMCLKLKRYVNLCLKPLNLDQYVNQLGEVNYYYQAGWISRLARSPFRVIFMTLVVLLNVVWMSYDAEVNDSSALLHETAPHFQIGENIFCAIFTAEVCIRVAALQGKHNCFKDKWMCFDTFLVALMIFETWLLPLVAVAGAAADGQGLVVVRTIMPLLRVARLGRLARLLRSAPEIMTQLRGIGAALRSVGATVSLLALFLYVFGVMFESLADEHEELQEHFNSVPTSMLTLLVHGAFLDSPHVVLALLVRRSPVMTFFFILFIFLSSYTLLNMLVGILVNVHAEIALKEKNGADVAAMTEIVLELMELYNMDDNEIVTKSAFSNLMNNKEMVHALHRFGVDKAGLVLVVEALFESVGEISFMKFLDIVMRLRLSGNRASVMDVADLREYVSQRFDELGDAVLKTKREGRSPQTGASFPEEQVRA